MPANGNIEWDEMIQESGNELQLLFRLFLGQTFIVTHSLGT